MSLQIKDLHVEIEGKEILKGINLEVNDGEIVALMGRNGSGKSTLANVIMGNPRYKVTKGEIIFKNKKLKDMEVDERAKLGLFMSFQYPAEISGVTISNFLRTALNEKSKKKLTVLEFRKLLREKLKLLDIDDKFIERYLNEGFSGGEKKKSEILQLAVLNPELAILDEVDSGADVDSLKSITDTIHKVKTDKMSIIVITHYNRILKYLQPDKVYVMREGKVVAQGGKDLAEKIDKEGFAKLK